MRALPRRARIAMNRKLPPTAQTSSRESLNTTSTARSEATSALPIRLNTTRSSRRLFFELARRDEKPLEARIRAAALRFSDTVVSSQQHRQRSPHGRRPDGSAPVYLSENI